jgi:uncharacterized protein (DUF433 family)
VGVGAAQTKNATGAATAIAKALSPYRKSLDFMGQDRTELSQILSEACAMDKLLDRITVNPDIFGGKPIIRGRRLAVEHILGMLAANDSVKDILAAYPWLEAEDIQACLTDAHRLAEHERVEPFIIRAAA